MSKMAEYSTALEAELLEKILDNTRRQVRFFQSEHRTLNGLQKLLQKRRSLLQQLEQLRRGRKVESADIITDVAIQAQLRELRQAILAEQATAIQAAGAEKNRIAAKLNGNRMTRNVRNAYIMRWYQGVSRGFCRQG